APLRVLFPRTAGTGPIPVETRHSGNCVEISLVQEKSAVRHPFGCLRAMRDEGAHQVAMVRLHNYSPPWPDCASQGSEDGHVLLFRSISKRGEDIARDIEARFGEGQP